MATTRASCVEVVDNVADSLLPLQGSNSEVWKNFGFPAKHIRKFSSKMEIQK